MLPRHLAPYRCRQLFKTIYQQPLKFRSRPILVPRTSHSFNAFPNARGLSSSSKSTHYGKLGVSEKASAADIKDAWHKLRRIYHPDNKKTGNKEIFQELSEAYEILADPETKADYDRSLAYKRQIEWRIERDRLIKQAEKQRIKKQAGEQRKARQDSEPIVKPIAPWEVRLLRQAEKLEKLRMKQAAEDLRKEVPIKKEREERLKKEADDLNEKRRNDQEEKERADKVRRANPPPPPHSLNGRQNGQENSEEAPGERIPPSTSSGPRRVLSLAERDALKAQAAAIKPREAREKKRKKWVELQKAKGNGKKRVRGSQVLLLIILCGLSLFSLRFLGQRDLVKRKEKQKKEQAQAIEDKFVASYAPFLARAVMLPVVEGGYKDTTIARAWKHGMLKKLLRSYAPWLSPATFLLFGVKNR